jgi:SHS2 domain-containing protein
MPFELLEHEADVGVKAWGRTWSEAFTDAARGLFEISVDTKTVEPREERIVELSADSMESLFLDFLNELILLRDTEWMLFSKFKVVVDEKSRSLKATAWGEKIDQKKHKTRVEAKAATPAGLRAWEEKGQKFVQCIVDV